MNEATMTAMIELLSVTEDSTPCSVLDVGSLDINGSYRKYIEGRGWKYTGLDIVPGNNVDVVAQNPYLYPFENNTFDIVISGSVMEHVQAIWLWVPELVRVLKPEGMLAIVTHWSMDEHRFPIDCWRILPDGMEYLFRSTGRLWMYNIRITDGENIAASARKIR